MRKTLIVLLHVLLIAYFSLFFFRHIDLRSADLGRHLINGKIIVTGSFEEKLLVLTKNFYSYTEPNYDFINHHWLSGVIFYFIHLHFGFVALSIFYGILSASVVLIIFHYAKNRVTPSFALILALFVASILSLRTEIRPEIFTYLFFTIFLVLLQKNYSKLRAVHFISLVLMQIVWVNLHNYAVLSFVLVGAYLLSSLEAKDIEQVKKLGILLILLISVSLINPNTYKTLLVPLNIFREFSTVKPSENIPLYALNNPVRIIFFTACIVSLLTCIYLIVKGHARKHFALVILLSIFSGASLFMYRMVFHMYIVFPLFVTTYIKYLPDLFRRSIYKSSPILAAVFVIAFLPFRNDFGVGLKPGTEDAGIFMAKNGIEGPIFNDYNTGSYLTYYLYGNQRVFIDGRPEAFSSDFLKNVYKPVSESEKGWERVFHDYNPNVIFLSKDASRTSDLRYYNFVLSRLTDSKWVLVFNDDDTFIFVRDQTKDIDVIKRFEISKEVALEEMTKVNE